MLHALRSTPVHSPPPKASQPPAARRPAPPTPARAVPQPKTAESLAKNPAEVRHARQLWRRSWDGCERQALVLGVALAAIMERDEARLAWLERLVREPSGAEHALTMAPLLQKMDKASRLRLWDAICEGLAHTPEGMLEFCEDALPWLQTVRDATSRAELFARLRQCLATCLAASGSADAPWRRYEASLRAAIDKSEKVANLAPPSHEWVKSKLIDTVRIIAWPLLKAIAWKHFDKALNDVVVAKDEGGRVDDFAEVYGVANACFDYARMARVRAALEQEKDVEVAVNALVEIGNQTTAEDPALYYASALERLPRMRPEYQLYPLACMQMSVHPKLQSARAVAESLFRLSLEPNLDPRAQSVVGALLAQVGYLRPDRLTAENASA